MYFSIFLILFDLIYEQFAHGVSSNYMRFAFLIPAVVGAIIIGVYRPFEKHPLPEQLLEMGSTTLVVGCLLKGIFDIYGSVDPLVWYFFYIGGLLIFSSIIVFCLPQFSSFVKREEEHHE